MSEPIPIKPRKKKINLKSYICGQCYNKQKGLIKYLCNICNKPLCKNCYNDYRKVYFCSHKKMCDYCRNNHSI